MPPARDSSDDYTRLAALVGGKVPLSGLFKEMEQVFKGRMGIRNMYVALIEQEVYLSFPYYVDEKSPEHELEIYPMEGATAAVIRSRRRRWLVEEPGLLQTVAGIGEVPEDWLGVPLIDRDGLVLGVLAVQSYDKGFRLRQEDADFVEFAAIQVALAVQFHAIDREIAVRRIESLVEETTDLEMIYPGIHTIVAGIIPSALASFIIARLDSKAGVFRLVYCVDDVEELNTGSWPSDAGSSGYIVSGAGQSFIYEDGLTPDPVGFAMFGARPAYFLGVPIRLGSHIMGVVMTQSYDREQKITREDQRMLEEICPFIAAAIARTELFGSVHNPSN